MVATLLGSASSVFATAYPWDTMFSDAGTAITALGVDAGVLIGVVFAAIVLLLLGFRMIKKIANKA